MSTTQAPSRWHYLPLVKIASGGMATVYLGASEDGEFAAIKCPHEHLLEDLSFRQSLSEEAHLASRIHHPNVVGVRLVDPKSLRLVMDYVEGASLGQLLVRWGKGGPALPAGVALRIVIDACMGLHAAHELAGDDGAPLGLVHRDVSPQNLLVGTDGVTRVADFGLAKCMSHGDGSTTQGTLKGKLGYMSPEYVRGRKPDRRADIFALGVVLWESLAGKRLFKGNSEPETIDQVLREIPARVSVVAPDGEKLTALDEIVARSLEKQPDDRCATAKELGDALAATGLAADHAAVGAFVTTAFGADLADRRAEVSRSVRVHQDVQQKKKRKAPRRLVIAAIALAVVAAAGYRLETALAPAPIATATAAPMPTPTPNATPAPTQDPTPTPTPTLTPTAASSTPRPRVAPSTRPHLPPPNPYASASRPR